jgi:hypothetical protein
MFAATTHGLGHHPPIKNQRYHLPPYLEPIRLLGSQGVGDDALARNAPPDEAAHACAVGGIGGREMRYKCVHKHIVITSDQSVNNYIYSIKHPSTTVGR